MKMFTKWFQKWFPKTYHVEVVRYWEPHSYDAYKKKMTYNHPMFLIWECQKFHKPKMVEMKWGNNPDDINEALDFIRQKNGSDYECVIDGKHSYKE